VETKTLPENVFVFASCIAELDSRDRSTPSLTSAASSTPKQIAEIMEASANPARTLHKPAATNSAVME